MITFLPSPDFTTSASMLDSKRLGNQRVEARMILRWLRDPQGYPRHQNAGYTSMWRGYELALCLYYNACCEEWARRGGKNIVCQPEMVTLTEVRWPPWLGDEDLHRTHRSALLHKLPGHYEQYGWRDEINDPKVDYLWPILVEGGKDNGEYELRPAYWKKGKVPNGKKKVEEGTRARSARAKAKRDTTKVMPKKAPKATLVLEIRSTRARNVRSPHPSRRRLRRSPRLAQK
ncbi:hypothetical protein ACHAWF_017312 [Thalassiosira exigua]